MVGLIVAGGAVLTLLLAASVCLLLRGASLEEFLDE
jgi:hypothetical protein